jgi:hypothetical protein
MANTNNKKSLRKDAGLAADLGDALASTLAALKVGEGLDIVQQTQPPVQSKVAAELGPLPKKFFDEGIGGAGRAPPGIAQYVTKLEREPAGTPGYGRTSPGQSSTTSRADSLAIGSDFRAAGGTDENGEMSFGPETKPTPNPERFPDPAGSRDSGGPIAVDGRRMPMKRPTAHRHPGEEEGAL